MGFRRVAVLLLGISLSFGVRGQGIEALQAQRKAAQQRIDEANRLIKESTDSTRTNLARISLLESQIGSRNDLLVNLGKQVRHYQAALLANQRRVDSLEHSLSQLKDDYARFLRASQFSIKKYSVLMYILASEDLSQFYRRIRFYKEYLTYQRSQYDAILQQEELLRGERALLKENQARVSLMHRENEKTKFQLEQEQLRYNEEVERLKRTQKGLQQQLEADKQRMDKLQAAIEQLLEAERKQNEKAKRGVQYLDLSKSFRQNKGKLPWPVNSGAITRGYGLKRSTIYRNVQTNSEGVYITTKTRAKVYPVFPGRVTLISEIAGQNIIVIVRHGDYLSVYSNLCNVQVKANDEVTAKSVLGEVDVESGQGSSVLHFEIWKSGKGKPSSEDPQQWLRP